MKPHLFLPIILLFALMLTNCNEHSKYETFADFPVSLELSHKPISLGTPIMYPSGFVFLDSALVVLDISGDYFLSFFTLDDYSLINQSVRRGRGPMEEESVFGLFKGMDKNELWYKTLSGIKIVKYNMGEENMIYKRDIPNCDSFEGVTLMLNDEVLGIPRYFQNKEFVKISTEDCAIIEFGPGFPDVGKNLEMEGKSILGTKSITVKPDGSLFAASYHYFPMLRIYNADDGSLKADARLGNSQEFPLAKIDPNASQTETLSTITNYYTSNSTNRYIYASYSGKSLLDLQPDIIQEGFKIMDFTNEIHVFDWDGNPVKRLILDKRIFAFAVSPDDKTLLAIPMSEPDNLLLYDLFIP